MRAILTGAAVVALLAAPTVYAPPVAHADIDSYLNCVQARISIDDDTAVQLAEQIKSDRSAYTASGASEPGGEAAKKLMREHNLTIDEAIILFGCVNAFLPGRSSASAADGTSAGQNFLSAAAPYRPPVTDQRLLELGYQACSVRRAGGSSDEAKSALWRSLSDQGIISPQVVVGSLVHVAVDTLCPEVGYP